MEREHRPSQGVHSLAERSSTANTARDLQYYCHQQQCTTHSALLLSGVVMEFSHRVLRSSFEVHPCHYLQWADQQPANMHTSGRNLETRLTFCQVMWRALPSSSRCTTGTVPQQPQNQLSEAS